MIIWCLFFLFFSFIDMYCCHDAWCTENWIEIGYSNEYHVFSRQWSEIDSFATLINFMWYVLKLVKHSQNPSSSNSSVKTSWPIVADQLWNASGIAYLANQTKSMWVCKDHCILKALKRKENQIKPQNCKQTWCTLWTTADINAHVMKYHSLTPWVSLLIYVYCKAMLSVACIMLNYLCLNTLWSSWGPNSSQLGVVGNFRVPCLFYHNVLLIVKPRKLKFVQYDVSYWAMIVGIWLKIMLWV